MSNLVSPIDCTGGKLAIKLGQSGFVTDSWSCAKSHLYLSVPSGCSIDEIRPQAALQIEAAAYSSVLTLIERLCMRRVPLRLKCRIRRLFG